MENDTLFWHGDQVWPERLVQLREYPHLRRLILWGGALTAGRLAGLGALTQLTAVAIGECAVDSSVLPHLAPLHALEFLNLSHTRVSGGWRAIAHLPLRELRLEGCSEVGDAQAEELAGIAALRTLVLRSSSVTEKGAGALRTRLPGCGVVL